MPHAWKAGEQTLLLRRQLEAMADGGLVVISAPANPFRCPPGPYERASLIAHYLKTKKPRSKLIVLDAKDAFSKQRLFQSAWAELYPGLLEWVPLSKGGNVTSVDAATRTLVTDFGRHQAAVANVIPPQKAGPHRGGRRRRRPQRLVPDRSGDVRVEARSPAFTSSATPPSPARCRSRRSPRTAQAKTCAAAVARLLTGGTPSAPKLINTCYSLVAPDYGISVAGVYAPSNGQLADVPGAGGVSPADAPRAIARGRGGARRGLVPHHHRRGVRVRLGGGGSSRSAAWSASAQRERRRCPESLTGAKGDPARGRAIVANRQVGLCLLCHSGPFPEERFQGDLAPDLRGRRARDGRRASCGSGSSIRAGSIRRRSCRRIIEPRGWRGWRRPGAASPS